LNKNVRDDDDAYEYKMINKYTTRMIIDLSIISVSFSFSFFFIISKRFNQVRWEANEDLSYIKST